MIIALVGNDASGKTTIARRLRTELASKYDVLLVNEFNYAIGNYVKRLLNRKKKNENQQPTLNHSHIQRYKRVLPYLIWCDLLLKTIALKIISRSKLVILDRCQYDFLATWKELNVNNGLINFMYKQIPKPDVAFLIVVAPNEAYERRNNQAAKDAHKPNIRNIEFYEYKLAIYKDLNHKHQMIEIDNSGPVESAVSEILEIINIRIRLNKIHIIAISGLDGTGKSTTVQNLANYFDAIHVPVRHIHFYYNYLPLKLFKYFKKSSPSLSIPKSVGTAGKRPRVLVNSSKKNRFWKWLVLADAFIQYTYCRLRYPNRLLIFDRYFHDYLVSFEFLHISHNRNLLLKLFPTPDRYFLLVGDYKVLHYRKPEHPLKFFKQCHERYKKMGDKLNMLQIDTTLNNERKTMRKVLAAI